MSAYIQRLKQHAQPTQPDDGKTQLDRKFETWWAAQPLATRHREYSMQELSAAMGSAGRILSGTLVKQGWTRKRRWAHKQHYYRLWLPPDD